MKINKKKLEPKLPSTPTFLIYFSFTLRITQYSKQHKNGNTCTYTM